MIRRAHVFQRSREGGGGPVGDERDEAVQVIELEAVVTARARIRMRAGFPMSGADSCISASIKGRRACCTSAAPGTRACASRASSASGSRESCCQVTRITRKPRAFNVASQARKGGVDVRMGKLCLPDQIQEAFFRLSSG